MKKLLLLLAFLLLLPFSLKAATLADLIADFRVRIAETDSTTSFMIDASITTLINMGQDKQVTMMGYIPKVQDIIFSEDSNSYGLNSDFKYTTGVMIFNSEIWEGVIPNPSFVKDTNVFSHDIKFHTSDQAYLYLRGPDMYNGDTVRVFYNGSAADLVNLTDSCEVTKDMHVRIIEESLIMFEGAKRSWQSQQLQWEQLRLDMGVIQKPAGGQQ